jgi:hypothetical protein
MLSMMFEFEFEFVFEFEFEFESSFVFCFFREDLHELIIFVRDFEHDYISCSLDDHYLNHFLLDENIRMCNKITLRSMKTLCEYYETKHEDTKRKVIEMILFN